MRPPCHAHLSSPLFSLNKISQRRPCGEIEADDGGRCHGYEDGQNLQVNSSSSLIWFNFVSIFEAFIPFLCSQWISEDEEFIVDARFSELIAFRGGKVCSGG
jgi:hypothetical protein